MTTDAPDVVSDEVTSEVTGDEVAPVPSDPPGPTAGDASADGETADPVESSPPADTKTNPARATKTNPAPDTKADTDSPPDTESPAEARPTDTGVAAPAVPATAAKADQPTDTKAATPTDTPVGPPADTPVGPPADTPVGPPADTPVGPPADTVSSGPAADTALLTGGSGGLPAAVTPELRRARPGRIRPVAATRAVRRATVAWAKRPVGRVVIPAVLAVLLIAVAGTAGAYLVPEAIRSAPSPSAALSGGPPVAPGMPGGLGSLGSDAPGLGPSGAVARPADALAGWAQQIATRVGVPVVAMQAYGYSELVLSRTMPGCRLSWTTIAAIAKVESAHGSANRAVLGADGQVSPPIIGLPLDGKGNRMLIADTDRGLVDGDAIYDRAVGPLQFIPTTWRENAVDADNDGRTDPNDIDDAALAAGMYLCRNARDLSKPDDWWTAILSYNNVRPYAQQVFTEANAYGQRSRT